MPNYSIRSTPGVNTTVYPDTTGPYGSVEAALEQAWTGDSTGTVAFAAPGSYTFTGAATLTRDRKTMVIPKAVTLISGPAAVGIATISGDFVTVEGGGKILVSTAVNDQDVLVFTGDNCAIINITIDVTASGGSAANPITVIHANETESFKIRDSNIFPAAGVRAIFLEDADFSDLRGVRIKPESGSTPRLCYRAIDVQGGYRLTADDVKIAYLGTTAAPLDAVIRLEDNDYETGLQHDDDLSRISINTVSCRTNLHSLGRKGLRCVDSRFLTNNTAVLNTNNYVDRWDAAILIDSVDANGIADDDNKYSAHVRLSNLVFDGASGIGASDIYVSSCAKVEIVDCRHIHFTGRYAVTVDADHTVDWKVDGGYFDGQYNTTTRPTQYHPILVINRLAASGTETAQTGQNGATELWELCENIMVGGAQAEGWLLTVPALSGGYGVFPPTIGVRGSYFPMGLDGFESYVGSTSISFSGPATITGTGLFTDVFAGDYIMVLGPANEENWGVRRVSASNDDSITVFNPDWKNNSDPTFEGTALSAGSGFTTVAFGDGTGVITRTGGSDWSGTLKPGMFLTIASADESGNDITVPAMITASTSTTVTLQGIAFTADASDANAVLTPSNGGWVMVNESAGAAIKVCVFKRGISEIGFARPLSTNIAGRNLA